MNLPMGGFCSLILLIVGMPDTKDSTRDKVTWRTISERLDLVGFVIFGGACVMLLLPLQWGGVKFPWGSSIIIGLFIGSFAAFCVFGFWQHKKGDAALIPSSIFQVREVVFSGLTTLFSRGAMFLHVYYLPLWFQMAKQATPFKSGLMTIPSFIAQIPFSMAAGFAGAITLYLVIEGAGLTKKCSPEIWLLHTPCRRRSSIKCHRFRPA